MINNIVSERYDLPCTTCEDLSSRAVMLAHQIHHRKLLLGLYGFLDGLDIASKTLVLITPLILTTTFEIWVQTPEGFYLSLIFIASLALLSACGNTFNGSKNKIEKTIYRFWQCLRDPIKGGKIASKGIKNIRFLTHALITHDLNLIISFMTMPIILLFMINRILNRYIGNQRKDFQEKNTALLCALENKWKALEKIREGKSKEAAMHDYLNFVTDAKNHQLKSQSQLTQFTLFISSFIETVINGTYLFMGTAALVPSSPIAILLVACVSMTMLVLNIFSAWHEELENQKKLQRTEQVFHVACAVHALERSLADANAPSNRKNIHHFIRMIEHKRLALEDEQNKHDDLYRNSFFEAFFVGLRYAIGAHKAIIGGLAFMALLSSLILGTALPEIIVLACMGLSVVASIALNVYAFEETRLHITQQNHHIQKQRKEINTHINNRIKMDITSIGSHSIFAQHTKPAPLPKRSILKEIEKARSYFSGSKKPKTLFELFLILQGESEYEMSNSPLSQALLLMSIMFYGFLWLEKARSKQSEHEPTLIDAVLSL